MSSQLVLRSVAEIAAAKLKFFIPDYQRGYRWEEDQVVELLNDLLEFFSSGKPLYCLQPLVVVSHGNEWEVVDGQQRLTTLFLLLSKLSDELPGFEIRYQRHKQPLGEIHQDISRPDGADDKPDFHYIIEAIRQIEGFLKKKPESREILGRVKGLATPAVSFIWYQLPEGDAIAAFTRLNAGKISLTDVELIRALLLRKDSELKESERLRIATAWDQMEKRLNEDEFWSFAAPSQFEPVNRIELVFHMVAGRRLDQRDHQLFHHAEKKIRSMGPRETWEEMEKAFSALEEWHDDHAFFHLIGYLSNAKGIKDTAIWNLYSGHWLSSHVATKDTFRKALKGMIRKDLLKDQDVRSYVDGLKYGESEIKSPLLCFNLASLMTDQHGTVRFSFHAFRNQNWDVEHIHALSSEEPTGPDLDGFLEMYRNYFETSREAVELLEKLKRALNPNSKADASTKAELYRECRESDKEEDLDEDTLNAIGNLTLLDSNTNRGYKNASYKVKRAWILDPNRQHIYVPPCTRSVFTKSYTAEAGELLRWNMRAGADGESYVAAMADMLNTFFQEAELIAPSPTNIDPAGNGRLKIPDDDEFKSQTSQESLLGETLSFLELLAAYRQIEIPLIQRDYAQGRKSEPTVRSAFMESIFRALSREDETLNLDFVYGTGKKLEIFHPIDGQQRLTTLFLLHWTVFWRLGQAKEFRDIMVKDGVSCFRYRVRPGAERFFPALLKWEPPSELSGENWFCEELPKQIWFSRNWLNDPTVHGALVMLDEIKMKIGGLSLDQRDALIKRLGRIQMEVLVLPNSIPADDIYLKMNARGKPLTDFEKFKAWLVGQVIYPEMGYDWKLRLDQEWLELFWGKSVNKSQRAATVSSCFFNTVLALAINRQAGHGRGQTEEKFADGINEWIQLGQEYRVDQWGRLFDAGTIRGVFTWLDGFHRRADDILNLMQSGDWISKEKNVISDPDPKLSLPGRCWLHAVALFCQGKCGDDEEWFRVARNLIANTDLRNIADFPTTIRSLDKLAARMSEGVLPGLTTLGDDEMEFFRPKTFRGQLEEERAKARLLSASAAAWDSIRDAENHDFLRGDIGILLESPTDGETGVNAYNFRKRWATFELLMNRGKMNSSTTVIATDEKRLDRLVIRAVLARCEPITAREVWLPWMADSSWGKALKRNADIKQFQDGLLRVIDNLIVAESHCSPDLQVKRLNEISGSPPISSVPWMKNLIKHGEMVLRESNEWKMQCYRWWRHSEEAHFVYHRKNTHELDVLIGEEFDVRNDVLAKLVGAGWNLTGAREIVSDGRKIYSGHHPELRRDGITMIFFYQRIELDENEQKRRIDLMNGDRPREIQDVLDELTPHWRLTLDAMTRFDDL